MNFLCAYGEDDVVDEEISHMAEVTSDSVGVGTNQKVSAKHIAEIEEKTKEVEMLKRKYQWMSDEESESEDENNEYDNDHVKNPVVSEEKKVTQTFLPSVSASLSQIDEKDLKVFNKKAKEEEKPTVKEFKSGAYDPPVEEKKKSTPAVVSRSAVPTSHFAQIRPEDQVFPAEMTPLDDARKSNSRGGVKKPETMKVMKANVSFVAS
jgi:hypothetical protein